MNKEMEYQKGAVFASACTGMLLFGIVMISLGSILPEVTDKFGLNEVEMGVLLTLLPSGILVGSLVFGPLVDWLSYKRILIAGTLVTLAGLEGIVYSDVLFLMHISVFFIGLGGGVLNGITNSLVSEISDEDHGANLSLLGVFFGLGALGTPVVLGLVKGIYSFETIFSWLGAFILLPVIFFLFTKFPRSEETRGLPVKEGSKLLREPLLLLFGVILFFQGGIEGLMNNWTTTYLETTLKVSPANALFLLSSFVGALTITRLILGKVLRMMNPLSVMNLGMLLALVGSVLLVMPDLSLNPIVGMIALGAGTAAGFPVILGYVGQTFSKLSGTAFSIVITMALIGNVVSNYLMGLVSQQLDSGVLPFFILIEVGVVLVLLFFTKRKYKGILEQPKGLN